MKLILLLFSLMQLVYGLTPQYSLINCTWPCPNASDKCVITSSSASCRPFANNNWIMNSPTRAPIYTGATVTIPNQACIPVPIPQLPVANSSAAPPAGQSIVYWPILNTTRRVQDDYMGNCGHSLYCYHSVCVNRVVQGSQCISSNQCVYGFCSNSTCHPFTDGNRRRSDRKTTVIAVASVFGVVGATIFSALIYRYRKSIFKTKKQAVIQPQVDKSKEDLDDERPPPYEP